MNRAKQLTWLIALCGVAQLAGAGNEKLPWFPLKGDPGVPQTDLIEVRPEPTGMGQRVLLDVRVSRSEERSSFKGLRYRSYTAKVAVNCGTSKAWYLWLSYHTLPLWKGEPIGREEYAEGEAPVLFRDVPGEPYKSLIAAACKSQAAPASAS